MDASIRISAFLVAAGVAAVCCMAVSLMFGGKLYYLTEHTTDERMKGVVDRLNSEPLYQSDDGALNKGYFLVGRQIQQRIVMPEDWDGEFGTVELPMEASHLPTEFLELVQLLACGRFESVQLYVEDEISIDVVFLNFAGQPVKRIRADARTC